jgi:hypothetical protein
MQLTRRKVGLFRMIVLAWAVLWMFAAPLVHIHPEADHHHGEAGHVHGGVIHLAFSPDLDGEYDDHHSTDGLGHSPFENHPAHALAHTELTLAFLSDSPERTLFKSPLVPMLTAEFSALNSSPPMRSVIVHWVVASPPLLLARSIPSRAPPSLLV